MRIHDPEFTKGEEVVGYKVDSFLILLLNDQGVNLREFKIGKVVVPQVDVTSVVSLLLDEGLVVESSLECLHGAFMVSSFLLQGDDVKPDVVVVGVVGQDLLVVDTSLL